MKLTWADGVQPSKGSAWREDLLTPDVDSAIRQHASRLARATDAGYRALLAYEGITFDETDEADRLFLAHRFVAVTRNVQPVYGAFRDPSLATPAVSVRTTLYALAWRADETGRPGRWLGEFVLSNTRPEGFSVLAYGRRVDLGDWAVETW